MSWIAEFALLKADFPLGRLFEQWPEMTVNLDRVVPFDNTVMPYFWVQGQTDQHQMDDVCTFLKGIPELRTVVLMDKLDGRGLFRAEWVPAYTGIMSAIIRADLTVLSARGSTDGWVFELRAEHGDQFPDFQQDCLDNGMRVELTRLSKLTDTGTDSEYGLTPEQSEALLIAYENGYFDNQRQTSTEALAKQLGISRQAYSSRLRRGYRNLIEHTIAHLVEASTHK